MSSPAPNKQPLAVVCATIGDHETAFVQNAAWEVDHLLRERFAVVSSDQKHALLPFGPDPAGFYATLLSVTQAGKGPGRSIPFGYISAHGGANGLTITRHLPEVFFSVSMRRFFRDAILVLNCCQVNENFPHQLCNGSDRVRAVVGYNGKLGVPSPEAMSWWWGTPEWGQVVEATHRALVEPVRALLQPGVTTAEARERTRARWVELHNLPIVDGLLRTMVQYLAAKNHHLVKVWGDGAATL